MKKLLLLAIVLTAAISYGQAPDTLWTRYFANQVITHMVPTRDGGFVALVSGFVEKFDSAGNVVWSRGIHGSPHDLQQTRDGGCIIMSSVGLLYLTRLDSNGNCVWERDYLQPPNPRMSLLDHIKETQDGGFVGFKSRDPEFGTCIWRFDAEGDTLWHRSVPDLWGILDVLPFADDANDGITLIYIMLWYDDPHGRCLKVQHWSQDGDSLGSWMYVDTTRWIDVLAVERSRDGRIFAAGEVQSPTHGEDLFTARLTPEGDTVWTDSYTQYDMPSDFSWATTVEITRDGGCIAGGSVYHGSTSTMDMLIVKLDSAGNEQWSQMWPGAGDNLITDIAQTSDGGCVAVQCYQICDEWGCYYTASRLIRFAPDSWSLSSPAGLTCLYLPDADRIRLTWNPWFRASQYYVYSSPTPGTIETLEAVVPAPQHTIDLPVQAIKRFYCVTAEYESR